jgi:TonB-dependent starch-binding outer membrane protein SusC
MLMTPRKSMILAGAAAIVSASCTHHSTPGPRAADSVEIGYGTQRKDKVTGAVTTVPTNGPRPLSIEELLRGKVAGLEVIQRGNAVSFRIRSSGTMTTDQEPLVIVDGEMIQAGNIAGALAGLTPDDIKQVSVLKDVASTSIYGGRGAAGVILITTARKAPPPADTSAVGG